MAGPPQRGARLTHRAGVRHPAGGLRAAARAFAHTTISTDGALLAYVEQSDTQQRVILRTIASGVLRRTLVTESVQKRVRWYGWSGPRYLLCGTAQLVRRPDRMAERTRLYSIDASDGHVRELNTRSEDLIRDQVIALVPTRPTLVLLQLERLGSGYPEVFELNVASGELRPLVRAHAPVRRWLSDGRGEVRLGIGYERGRGLLFVRERDADGWRSFAADHPLDHPDAMGPLSLGEDGTLYVLRQYRGRAALFSVDTQTMARSLSCCSRIRSSM